MDSATFSSWVGGTNIHDLPEDALGFVRMIMLNMDPPQHTKYRRLVSKGFTPKIVQAMEPHVRDDRERDHRSRRRARRRATS